MNINRTTLILSLIVLFNQTSFASTVDSLNQLLSSLKEKKHTESQIEVGIQLGDTYYKNKNYKQAILTFEKIFELARTNHTLEVQKSLLFKIGQTYNSLQKYPKAIEYLKDLLLNYLPQKPDLLSEIYSEISTSYQRLGNNELAYEYQLKALNQNKILKDSSKIARSLYKIGSIFFFQRNLTLAIDYYKKSLTICEKLNFARGIFNCEAAIGGAYSRLEDTENSLTYNLRAYEKATAMGYSSSIAYASHNLGVNYLAKGELNLALDFLLKSLKLKEEDKDKWGMVSTLRNIGDVYRLQNQPEHSLRYLNRALKIAEQLDSKPRLLETYTSMADFYRDFEDYEQASNYLFKALSLKDTLINETTLEKMSDAKVRFEIQEKEEALLIKDKEIASIYKWLWGGSIVFLVMMLWLIHSKYRNQMSYNLDLENKNQQIQIQNEQLAIANEIHSQNNKQIQAQNKQLEISNNQLQQFAFIASHDLKEPLRTIGSYSNLLQRRYESKLDSDGKEFLSFITGGVSRMYSLLNDVLDYSKVGSATSELEWVNPVDIIEEIKSSLQKAIQEKNAQIFVSNLPIVWVNRSHLYQILQNLISNGLKFNNSDTPIVRVSSNIKNNKVEFVIKDNGIGMEMVYRDKIFEIFQRLHSKHEFEGTGVGLAICKKTVEQYDGEIWVESVLEKGSAFKFTLTTDVKKPNNRVKMKAIREKTEIRV